jgi:phenylpropionate dioxygenase-like ring-hydroxylating dioxygenase large terminal subunit
MKKSFALALMATLLVAAVIPSIQAVSWKAYKAPKGEFSMNYPTNWKVQVEAVVEEGLMVAFVGPNDLGAVVVITEQTTSGLTGKFMDSTYTEEDSTLRMVMVAGKEYSGAFSFAASTKDFASANKQYFGPMIKSIKVK